jgi:clorobiocin biosynthesis protein CloN6
MKFDMILVHAPSVYDFRGRDDVLFAYLSNSDSVHVSPIFEMPPVGILAINQHLQKCGFKAEFFNVASQMLRHAEFDVEQFFKDAPSDYIGIDLHWQVHAHGSLELLKLYKQLYPSAKTVLGGIASTYFHEELIAYPQVDYVIRGYDTLMLVEMLLNARNSPAALAQIPNLTWKQDGQIHINPLTYAPRVYSAAVDWTKVFSGDRKGMTPYNLVIPQAGCEYNCRWCGGSRYFFRKYMGLDKGASRIHKAPEALKAELQTIAASSPGTHTVTMIDFWHEYPQLFDLATDVFLDDKIDCVHFSLHRLPTVEKGRRMGAPARAVIELSPDSHDLEVAKASGRGLYTMEEMEAFIDALLDDVYSFEIYFMLGLPKQTAAGIMETVSYCEHLLKKYQLKRVTPYVCPMLPFLDSGSEIYDNAETWGYTILHHSLEDHRRALLSMNWRDRLNYETKWLTRQQLVDTSYEAVRALALLKKKYGILPSAIANSIVKLIDSTRELLREIDAYQSMPPSAERQARETQLKRRILEYNRDQFKMVRSQQRPVDFGFSQQQWFDTEEAFERVKSGSGAVVAVGEPQELPLHATSGGPSQPLGV